MSKLHDAFLLHTSTWSRLIAYGRLDNWRTLSSTPGRDLLTSHVQHVEQHKEFHEARVKMQQKVVQSSVDIPENIVSSLYQPYLTPEVPASCAHAVLIVPSGFPALEGVICAHCEQDKVEIKLSRWKQCSDDHWTASHAGWLA